MLSAQCPTLSIEHSALSIEPSSIIPRTTGELTMSLPLRRLSAIVSVIVFAAAIVGTAYAQSATATRVPQWTKAAPFPIPEEELYGSVVNGKFYVLGGFGVGGMADRKSTRLNSSHLGISYAVF